MKSMNVCEQCKKETLNPKFCNLSCAGKWQAATKAWPIGYCKLCGKVFSKRKTYNKVFCTQSCGASYNNKRYPKRTHARKSAPCDYCEKATYNKYCNSKCHKQKAYEEYINSWLKNEIVGLTAGGVVTNPIKRWLRETRGDSCELCSWNQVNFYTNKVPVVADHIDGNWENNRPENLRLICPNCDSLSATYKGANKGNGRKWRLEQTLEV